MHPHVLFFRYVARLTAALPFACSSLFFLSLSLSPSLSFPPLAPMRLCLSVSCSLYLSVSLSLCLPVALSPCRPDPAFDCLYAFCPLLSSCLSACLSFCLSVHIPLAVFRCISASLHAGSRLSLGAPGNPEITTGRPCHSAGGGAVVVECRRRRQRTTTQRRHT